MFDGLNAGYHRNRHEYEEPIYCVGKRQVLKFMGALAVI
jgi:hypothetical protein